MIKILRSCSGRILDIIPDINDSGRWGAAEDWINVYVWIEDVKKGEGYLFSAIFAESRQT